MSYTTGLLNTLNNQAGSVRANQLINIQAQVNGFAPIVSTSVTSDSIGGFQLPFTIPFEQASKPIIWTFTEVSTSAVEVRTDTTPQYDPNITLTITNTGQVTLGVTPITGKVKVSQGYPVLLELLYNNSQVVGSINISEVQGLVNYSIGTPESAPLGTYTVRAKSINHVTKTIGTGALVIKEGVFIDDVTDTVYPTRSFNLTGKGPAGKTITVTAFSNTYNVVVSGNKSWSLPLVAPLAAGNYTIVASSAGVPNSSIQISVTAIPFTLSNCPVVPIETNKAFILNGRVRPDKIVTLTPTGLGLPVSTVAPDSNGNWTTSLSVPWQPPGNWSITFTAPGESPIICSGTHLPALVLTPSEIDTVQGAPASFASFRGLANTSYNYLITGALSGSGAIITDAAGISPVPIPAVPQLTQVPNTAGLTISTLLTIINIEAEVPGTINIGTPSAIVDSTPILWTNQSFAVTGDMADHGIFTLSADGAPATLTLNSVGANTYSATLASGSLPGPATIYLDIFRQDSKSRDVIISPEITFSIPPNINQGTGLVPITITSGAGELFSLEIVSDVDGPVVDILDFIPMSGTYTYLLDTNLLTGGELFFTIRNSYFGFPTQSRQVTTKEDIFSDLGFALEPVVALTRYPANEINSLNVLFADAIGNNFELPPYNSLLELIWAPPTDLDNFRFYLIEEYTNAGGWQTLATTTNTSYSPALPQNGYRVTAVYRGYNTSLPVYAGGNQGPLAKTSSDLSLFNSQNRALLNIPAPSSFFTATVQYSQSDSVGLALNARRVSAIITIPASPNFFTTLITTSQTSVVSASLTRVVNSPTITITPGTPFFTL